MEAPAAVVVDCSASTSSLATAAISFVTTPASLDLAPVGTLYLETLFCFCKNLLSLESVDKIVMMDQI